MRVKIMNCTKACEYARLHHNETSVMISIRTPKDPWTPKPTRGNNLLDILYLEFHDIDRPNSLMSGMTDEAGHKVAEFVHKWWGNVDLLIVHCDAGQSRSAGVAAAILKAMTGDDSQIYDSPLYTPNSLCYRKTLNALMG